MKAVRKWLPVVDVFTCDGCRRCVEACGPRSLQIVAGVAVLTDPESCGSEEHCIPVCAADAIRMDWVPASGDPRLGRWET